MQKPELSIVIPAYNEAAQIRKTLQQIYRYLQERDISGEVIVVDDGSTDKTSQVASKCGAQVIRHAQNKGKGSAVRSGMLAAKGKYVLFTDVDLSTPIEELDNLLKKIEQADVVIGSRALPDSRIKVPQSWYRTKLGQIFAFLRSLIILRAFNDTQCGFKIFRNSVVDKLFIQQRINGFGFDVEILFLAHKIGLRILEMPVKWRDSKRTTVKSKHAFSMFCDLWRIRINDWLGRYEI